ncbi:MAG: histidine kinase [Bacteroidales bacterium]|jgi:sensor histidine kinase YesM|nr:histidine kinase [Bacteroidales bacterium]
MKQINSLKTSLLLAFLISFITNAMLFLAFYYVRNNFSPPPHAHEYQPKAEYIEFIFRFVLNFITSFLTAYIFFKISEIMPKKKVRILLIILFSLLSTLIISYISIKIRIEILQDKVIDGRFIFGNMMRDAFIALVTFFSAQIMYLSRKQQQSAIENQKLEAENMQTRYQALKNQIDPHFLFNSLNTLNALIKTDPPKAEEYVLQLSYVFRYILQQEVIIHLNEELSFTQSYSNLMKIRYGSNLIFEFHIDTKFYDYEVLPLSLQILVENAIKHNIITAKQPLTISIFSNEDESITVSNKIQAKKEVVSGTKIGLSNLAERYRLMTKKEIIITNDENIFSVKIPIFKFIRL